MDQDSTDIRTTRRNVLFLLGGTTVLAGSRHASAQQALNPTVERKTTMKIDRNGSRPSTKGSPDYFSGSVRVEPAFQVGEPMRLNAGSVTFEPGARTAWHTHPLGQTLVVTAGLGWVQTEGGQIEEVRPGDVVWFPPGEKHWHGATSTTAMTHIAVQESLNGKNVDWLEKVSDAQYGK
jgi:quercetin dioxygenase-like cupin family protein